MAKSPTTKRQFQIVSSDGEASVAYIDNLLGVTAIKFNLHDNTYTSRVPKTIRSIVERKGHGFGIGGRVVGELIIIDISPVNTKEHELFSIVCAFLEKCLLGEFGKSIREVYDDQTIPIYPNLPKA